MASHGPCPPHRDARLQLCGADVYARGRPAFSTAGIGLAAGGPRACAPAKPPSRSEPGTGKFTRLLTATGAVVTAVEPVAAMLERLVSRLSSHVPALQRPGTKHSVCVGCTVRCRGLRPGFSLVRHSRRARGNSPRASAPVARWDSSGMSAITRSIGSRSSTQIMAPFEGDAPRYYNGEWRRVFPARGFGPLQEQVVRAFTHWCARTGDRRSRRIGEFHRGTSSVRSANMSSQEVRSLIASTPALRRRGYGGVSLRHARVLVSNGLMPAQLTQGVR